MQKPNVSAMPNSQMMPNVDPLSQQTKDESTSRRKLMEARKSRQSGLGKGPTSDSLSRFHARGSVWMNETVLITVAAQSGVANYIEILR
jgi:hypothetical protein